MGWSQQALPESSEVLQAAEGAPSMRRVLQTQSGTFLRGLTRLEDGYWHIGEGVKEQRLPARMVVDAQPEADLLREFQRQSKADGPAIELATWCLENGLLREGIQALDGALRMHGQRVAALELLQTYRRFLPQPPEWREGMDPGAYWKQQWKWLRNRNTPSLESLSAEAWAAAAGNAERTLVDGQVDPWMAALTEASTDPFAPARAFALTTLCTWRKERSAVDLRRFAILDINEQVRAQAGWLLGTLDDPKQVGPLIGWLHHDQGEVQLRAAQALGQAGYAAAVPALLGALSGGSGAARRVPHAHIFVGTQTAYIQDFSPEVAQGSAIADPEINVLTSGVVLDAGVASITIERHRIELRRALQRITGHRPGLSPEAWNRWLASYPDVNASWRAPWPSPEAVGAAQPAEPAPE
ncbi:MAG TPA: HEAT repeat domain-containing protein [Planctomycetota bacterium]|nr:HEAT repeat domain-containing protein [Planctomycetota bacterium]HRV80602.1 HEAT repeat domain-containing protein [Planctomycetota bacterium]